MSQFIVNQQGYLISAPDNDRQYARLDEVNNPRPPAAFTDQPSQPTQPSTQAYAVFPSNYAHAELHAKHANYYTQSFPHLRERRAGPAPFRHIPLIPWGAPMPVKVPSTMPGGSN